MSNKSIFNRILSAVAILATILVVFFSVTVISENVNHHCNDEEHCPVCAIILQCEQNIKTIGSGLILAVVSAMIIKVMVDTVACYTYQSVQTTLVSQKVRLDS
ncbi:hypothetical protein CIY_23970 [Butyrivibrio fibrisolvens 16/4]|uniref:Outer membrane lipoprotein-sorting protein n=1 Tax=uncultured bacterium Contigcl_289 TaxID=1393669 RepID=W0FSC5_9BACT|nr:outer membrane lipoprotein-sorting protein [uncultured bacterium Contigcl_289]CBK75040.1 hypothetical protein CIY_23970 [Butyrivibrio fibrisolvens 16/4]